MEVPFGQTQATHARRPFGANLTNIVQNDNRRRALKRTVEDADLDEGPAVKRTRYNLRPRAGRENEKPHHQQGDDLGKQKSHQQLRAEVVPQVQDENVPPNGGGFEPHKGAAQGLRKSRSEAQALPDTRQEGEPLTVLGNGGGASGSRLGTKPRLGSASTAPETVRRGGLRAQMREENEERLDKWDEPDKDDETMAVHYVKDIMLRLRRAEEEPGAYASEDFMKRQADISPRMRVILLDWLVDVHRKFELSQSTLYLCVSLLDRYLSVEAVPRSQLQLTGCACMWVASKYHEIYAPEIHDFVYISDDAFTDDDLIQREARLVQRLGFALTVPTPLPFADRFIKVGTHGVRNRNNKGLVRVLTYYLLEHALMDYQLSRTRPSLLAAACLCYALLGTRVRTKWGAPLAQGVGYQVRELFPTIQLLDRIVKLAPKQCRHQAVRKKYSHKRHGQIASYSFRNVNVKNFLRK